MHHAVVRHTLHWSSHVLGYSQQPIPHSGHCTGTDAPHIGQRKCLEYSHQSALHSRYGIGTGTDAPCADQTGARAVLSSRCCTAAVRPSIGQMHYASVRQTKILSDRPNFGHTQRTWSNDVLLLDQIADTAQPQTEHTLVRHTTRLSDR